MKIYAFCISKKPSDANEIIAINDQGKVMCEPTSSSKSEIMNAIKNLDHRMDIEYQIEWLDGGIEEYIQRMRNKPW